MPVEDKPTGISGIVRRGTKYCVRWRDPEGNSRRNSFDTLTEAKRFKTDKDASILTGAYIDPKERKISVRTWGEEWLTSMAWGKRTRERHTSILTNHVYPTFGGRVVSSITRLEVQSWVTKLSETKGLAPRTVGLYYRSFAQLMKAAVDNRKANESPCGGHIRLPEFDEAVADVLSEAQVMAIIDKLPGRYKLAGWLGTMAGLRIGEALGLTLERIDTERRELAVIEQWTADYELAPPKTKHSKRTIPIPDELLALIDAHVRQYGVSVKGTLFTNHYNNRPVGHREFTRQVKRATTAAGVSEDVNTFHAFRHHYASVLIDDGHSPRAVMELMGHSSITVTMNLYAKRFKEHDDKVRQTFTGRYGQLRLVPPPSEPGEAAQGAQEAM